MAYSKKQQAQIYELVNEFVMATHGHNHAILLEDNKAQDFFISRAGLAVDGLLAFHPDAILVLEPIARDEDTFMAVKAAGYLSLHRPEIGLPLLNHLHDTTIGTYDCVWASSWLRECEYRAKQAAGAVGDGGEPRGVIHRLWPGP